MARFRLFTSAEAVKEAGYRLCTPTEAETYRRLGVPLYQRGFTRIAGLPDSANHFVPVWAAELLQDWPPTPSGVQASDLGFLLERVVRRVVATGDYDLAKAASAVARLSGGDAVRSLLDAHEKRP